MSTPSCSHWPWLNSFAHNHRNWLFKVVQQRLGLLTRDYAQIDGEFQLAATSQRLISIFLLHLNIAETWSAYFFSGSQCFRTTSRILILTTFTDNFKYKHMPNISPAKTTLTACCRSWLIKLEKRLEIIPLVSITQTSPVGIGQTLMPDRVACQTKCRTVFIQVSL